MDEYPAEASVDIVQALRRALLSYRPEIHAPVIHKPNLPSPKPVIQKIKPVVQKEIKKVETSLSRLDKSTEKLIGMALKAHDILFRANTVFPFNLFPDTVTVDREKLTIANRFFFATAKITSVPIRDILSVEADVGPFFGSIQLTSRYFFTNPRSVTFLRRKDALDLQRLLQGYIIAHEQHIDCSKMDAQQLKILLEDLGRGDTD